MTHGRRDVRRVALTFDDGPDALTERILAVLSVHGARATFNVLGERVHGREHLLARVVAAGHELGNHAFAHEDLAGRPLAALRGVARTNRLIRSATGRRPLVFRPPYGRVSAGVVAAARAAGLVTVGWDVDPRDYETPGAEAIHRRVAGDVLPGSIIVLHDGRRAREQTAVALDGILATLSERGYGLATASELLGLRPPPGDTLAAPTTGGLAGTAG